MLSAASGADEKDDQYIVEHYHEAITLKEIAESASIRLKSADAVLRISLRKRQCIICLVSCYGRHGIVADYRFGYYRYSISCRI